MQVLLDNQIQDKHQDLGIHIIKGIWDNAVPIGDPTAVGSTSLSTSNSNFRVQGTQNWLILLKLEEILL